LVRHRDGTQSYHAVSEDERWFRVPANGERVALFGFWGGEGQHETEEGWRLQLAETGPSVRHRQEDAEPFVLQDAFAGTYRASSFSPSGSFIVLVDSATTQVHVRSED